MMKKIEENANRRGMSYITMMENAGKACFEKLMKVVIKNQKPEGCILCGKGKNGGDGFVIARYLAQEGRDVTVIKVNTVNVGGKEKRTGAYPKGFTADWKKAIVKLTAESKTIELFEGMV